MRRNPEHLNQCALFKFARMPSNVAKWPALKLLEGSMNGVHLSKAQAGKAIAAGMLKGSHDIRLPVARGDHIGLSIELKHGDNQPTQEQLAVGDLLESEGWRVRYCWGWEAAWEEIVGYLALPSRVRSGSL